jgi:hypothetical protein
MKSTDMNADILLHFIGLGQSESITASCKCWLLFEPGANPCYEGSPNARQTDIPLTSDVAKAY